MTEPPLRQSGDWVGCAVAGGAFVKANGGRVELLPLLPGHSTSATIGRLRGDGD